MTTLDSLNIRRFYRDAYLHGVDGEKHMEEWCKALTQGIEARVLEVIGENFTEVTKYDQIINGVFKIQRERLTKLLKGGEKE